MKPPTLRQLRMDQIQRKIIERTNAGLQIGMHVIDSSTTLQGIRRNKATFGDSNLRVTNSKTTKQAGGTKTIQAASTSQQNNLSYDEVKSLSDKYFLPCKNVYELHAEFNSMLKISKH